MFHCLVFDWWDIQCKRGAIAVVMLQFSLTKKEHQRREQRAIKWKEKKAHNNIKMT